MRHPRMTIKQLNAVAAELAAMDLGVTFHPVGLGDQRTITVFATSPEAFERPIAELKARGFKCRHTVPVQAMEGAWLRQTMVFPKEA